MATEKHQQDPPPEQYLPTATGSRGGAGPARSTIDEYTGRKRKLIYPPAPEPAPVPVVDNHAHLDFRDGLVQVHQLRRWMLLAQLTSSEPFRWQRSLILLNIQLMR